MILWKYWKLGNKSDLNRQMSNSGFILLWGSAIGGAWLAVQFAPPGLEFRFGFIGFIAGPILVTIYEMKSGRRL